MMREVAVIIHIYFLLFYFSHMEQKPHGKVINSIISLSNNHESYNNPINSTRNEKPSVKYTQIVDPESNPVSHPFGLKNTAAANIKERSSAGVAQSLIKSYKW